MKKNKAQASACAHCVRIYTLMPHCACEYDTHIRAFTTSSAFVHLRHRIFSGRRTRLRNVEVRNAHANHERKLRCDTRTWAIFVDAAQSVVGDARDAVLVARRYDEPDPLCYAARRQAVPTANGCPSLEVLAKVRTSGAKPAMKRIAFANILRVSPINRDYERVKAYWRTRRRLL